MKTNNYYIHISDGVYLSKEPKPIRTWQEGSTRVFITWDEHQHLLKEWYSKLIPVENTGYNAPTDQWFWYDQPEGSVTKFPFEIEEGQQVTAEIKDGKATITKLGES